VVILKTNVHRLLATMMPNASSDLLVRERDRETETETDRQTDRLTGRETETERQRETD
jgi:hypothetical protein